MENLGSSAAVIISGPGKSPPVFNLLLDMAPKHGNAVAMVFMEGHDHGTECRLSWEADYALNIGLAVAAKQELLVILHDDKLPGRVQTLGVKVTDNKENPYALLTVHQFLLRHCASSRIEVDGFDAWLAADGVGVAYCGEKDSLKRVSKAGADRFEGYVHRSGSMKQGVCFHACGARRLYDSIDDVPVQAGRRTTGRILLDDGTETSGTWEFQPRGPDGKFGPHTRIA